MEGLLYSARRVLSNPVTEISCGTRQPAFIKPLMTPTAVRSLIAITAVGLGNRISNVRPATRPPSKPKSPGRIGPGSQTNPRQQFLLAFKRAHIALNLGV